MSGDEILIMSPRIGDIATEITYDWSLRIAEFLEENEINYTHLSAICKAYVDRVFKIVKPEMLIFLGHGEEDGLVCKSGFVIDFENISLLKNKDVITIACLSASKLGYKAVEEGARSYFGYSKKFMIVYNEKHGYYYDGFFEPNFMIIKTLIETSDYIKAYHAAVDWYDTWIDFYWEKEEYVIAAALNHNKEALTLILPIDDKAIVPLGSKEVNNYAFIYTVATALQLAYFATPESQRPDVRYFMLGAIALFWLAAMYNLYFVE